MSTVSATPVISVSDSVEQALFYPVRVVIFIDSAAMSDGSLLFRRYLEWKELHTIEWFVSLDRRQMSCEIRDAVSDLGVRCSHPSYGPMYHPGGLVYARCLELSKAKTDMLEGFNRRQRILTRVMAKHVLLLLDCFHECTKVKSRHEDDETH